MTVSFPYPVAFLSDLLRCMSGRMDVRRRDELSGSGDGRVWSSELATPLWTGAYTLTPERPAEARSIDARVRGLGTNRAMLFCDPGYQGPAADPGGVILGASAVMLHTISTDRTAIRLTGLPASYSLSAGDRISILHSTDRYWLAELVEPITASVGGLTPLVSIHPYVPLAVTVGVSVEVRKPVCKMVVPPGGYTSFESRPGYIAANAQLQLIQKL